MGSAAVFSLLPSVVSASVAAVAMLQVLWVALQA